MSTWYTRYVNTPGETVNVRKGPSKDYSVVTTLGHATKVEVNEPYNTWSQVRRPNEDILGYVMTEYLTVEDPYVNIPSTTFTAGHFGKTNTTQVKVRKSPSTSAGHYNNVVKGSTFLIEGVVNGTAIDGVTTWVKIRYGTASGDSKNAYIHSNYFTDIGAAPNSAKDRCITIAKSLNKNTEANLGLGGECCQMFIYWLCGACGIQVDEMPYGLNTCGPARDYFKNTHGEWHSITENYTPKPGDLVYYGETNGTTSNHVGFVVVGGNNYQSIECNLSNMVKLCTGDVASEYCQTNGKHIQGFATPTWN